MQTPHVQIIVDRPSVPPPLQNALMRLGARVSIRSLDKAAKAGITPSADVCIILPGEHHCGDLLERVMASASEHACATMVLPADHESESSAGTDEQPTGIDSAQGAGGAAVATVRLRAPELRLSGNPSTEELTGRIQALCDIRDPLRQMHDELRRLRRQTDTSAAVRHLDEQLRLAGQVQNDLLPDPLSDTAPLTISTLYLPADYISGDIYNLARLDEDRFAFSIADVTGHGLPAALLTFLIKSSMRGKEIFNGSYRIVDPDELLGRMNEDLINAHLSQCQFVTALHAVFDRATRMIRWARAGSPYPLLVRPGEPPRLIHSEGGLLGAIPQTFQTVEHVMRPGDTLLFYTDGVEALLFGRGAITPTALNETAWAQIIAREGVGPALSALRQTLTECLPDDWPEDDITVIAVEMN